jgi:3-dehydroquinate dehydratase / shikimate dehydrogenase
LARNPIPGLPSLDSLWEAYKLEHVNANTKVFGLISKPVSHSKGPILHNPSFRHVNCDGIHVPMFVDDLKKFFSTYSSPDFTGFRYVKCYLLRQEVTFPATMAFYSICYQIIHLNVCIYFFFIMNCSVGIPYKEEVLRFCDEVHPLAQVNCPSM